eukprot:5364512-Pyramimonas_sp.AAC.2
MLAGRNKPNERNETSTRVTSVTNGWVFRVYPSCKHPLLTSTTITLRRALITLPPCRCVRARG